MKQILTTVTTTATAALFALPFVATCSTAASAYECCCTEVTSHILGCSFSSKEQCLAMSSGRGGDCDRDPFLAVPSGAYAYQPKNPRSRTKESERIDKDASGDGYGGYGSRASGLRRGFRGYGGRDVWGHWGAYYGPMIPMSP